MNESKLEAQRKRWTAKAEADFGMSEGVKRLVDGDRVTLVKIWPEFYPKTHWLVCDVSGVPMQEVPSTTRPLTDEIKAKLESWL